MRLPHGLKIQCVISYHLCPLNTTLLRAVSGATLCEPVNLAHLSVPFPCFSPGASGDGFQESDTEHGWDYAPAYLFLYILSHCFICLNLHQLPSLPSSPLLSLTLPTHSLFNHTSIHIIPQCVRVSSNLLPKCSCSQELYLAGVLLL